MRKIYGSGALLALLLLTGCGQNAPTLGTGSNSNITDASAITGDTITINESGEGSSGNSSSDGFQSIYFSFGDYGISSSMERVLSRNVSVARKASRKIKIEGNCDEFGTDEYNYALGLKRAKAVKDALASQGLSPSNMVIVSFGESNPICSSPTDACYAKNRRVDLHLIK